jgi:hypothetical protein
MKIILVCLFAGSLCCSSAANAACNYSSADAGKNCKDAVDDYWNKTRNHQGSSYQDVEKRVETLKDTLRECKDCTMDRLESQVNQILKDIDDN